MSTDLIRSIAELSQAVPGTPGPKEAAALQRATRALIRAMQDEGRLAESPMRLALTRTVDLHQAAAERRLRGKRVLVTGGSGCVGTRLRQLLAGFGPATLVNLDIAPQEGEGRWLQADIRDPAMLDKAFRAARPEVVFHLAGIREPGKAELLVRDAVETNVFGTANVIAACRRHGVGHAVYSSTGKCYAYLTDHVYTASKKLAEMQWLAAARAEGDTAFAMTRFTHVLENGIVSRDIAAGIAHGMVGLHGPDRHFNIQNLRQATHLLVNALALAGLQAPGGFWSAVDLGWPVNTLELALFEIARSGREAGVRFLGIPKGYDESFFRGQFDWSGAHDYHPLVNALEAPSMAADSTGTMIGAQVPACPEPALQEALLDLGAALMAGGPDGTVKQALLQSVDRVTAAVFSATRPERLLDILWWGAAPGWIEAGTTRYRPLMALLADMLLPALARPEQHWDDQARTKLQDVAASFAGIPGLGRRAERLLAVMQPLRAA